MTCPCGACRHFTSPWGVIASVRSTLPALVRWTDFAGVGRSRWTDLPGVGARSRSRWAEGARSRSRWTDLTGTGKSRWTDLEGVGARARSLWFDWADDGLVNCSLLSGVGDLCGVGALSRTTGFTNDGL